MIEEQHILDVKSFLEGRKYELQSHNFNHLLRTAEGTRVFIRDSAEDEMKNRAYIVGLLHETSGDQAKMILRHIGVEDYDVSKIIYSIDASRKKSFIHYPNMTARVVSFSNDMLEGDGGFGVYRTCYFCGEARRYNGSRAEDAITDRLEHHKRYSAKNPIKLPTYVARLIEYQSEWSNQFLGAMKSKEPWATDMGSMVFLDARAKHGLEYSVRNFDIKSAEQEKFVKEAIGYLDGARHADFKNLVFPELA